ncbi:CBASS oligonucleotide cyclase [Burkholderia gladioli]|uniref:CBASS oligonucleotide cyclase n=1 Tax=Burkholderia gladioli TaxID=28095 RepID=UPI002FE32D9A
MPLSNAKLLYYDHEVLRLPKDKRTEYHAQVDRLIVELSRSLKDQAEIKVTRVVKAGSFAKHTILRKTPDDPVDVDVVFYIDGKDVNKETIESLGQTIYDLLVKQYPNKKVEDFQIQRKAATVEFIGSGLAIDVVPVIQIPSKPDFGWQYDIEDGSRSLTSAPGQIKFVRDRRDKYDHFRTLVRLAKRWRRKAEVPGLKSFHLELILAYLLDNYKLNGTIEERFRAFLVFLYQDKLKTRIEFEENKKNGTPTSFSDPVVIVDPVSNANNTASRISEEERLEIANIALETWETIHLASIDDDDEEWKNVFGRGFRTEEKD